MPVVIEPLTSHEDIEGILSVEEACFTNPWTRDMYLGELVEYGSAGALFGNPRQERTRDYISGAFG